MWGYDGQTFTTVDQFTAYLQQKFGNSYLLNLTSINNWGEDLLGNQVYYNGIAQTGSLGAQYAADGFQEAQAVMDAYTANPAQVSADTIAQLNRLKQAQEATIQGSTYTNDAIQLGTEEAQGGQVLVATTPVVSDNGTPFNAPKVMAEEAVEDPTVPGTFSYLATLKALGWLPLPTWTAAVAPLLGVGLGVAMYDLNPQFWEKVSRTLLPFCYDDNGTPKMPVSVDENGNVHTPETAIEAFRNLLIEEDAYDVTPVIESQHKYVNSNGDVGYFNLQFNRTYTKAALKQELGLISDGTIISKVLTNYDAQVSDVLYYGFVYGQMNYGSQSYDFRRLIYLPTPRTNSSTQKYIYCYFQRPNGYSGIRCYYYNPTTITEEQLIANFDRAMDAWSDIDFTFDGASTTSIAVYELNGNSWSEDVSTSFVSYGLYSKFSYYTLFGVSPIVPSSHTSLNSNPITLGFNTSGQGVEGVTPEEGATYPTDTTKNLAEIYPTWAGNAINVVNNPTGTTIEDSTEKWYPVSLSNTNYSTDTANTSSTQTQTDAQSGTNTDSSQLNQIAQALQELTQTLTESGTLPPNPTIPSDPSGDTPTPTPPVITGAGSDLIAIYNPTKTQLQQFNQFLWSLDPTNLTNWKKVFANPIDAIIALQMIYVTPITGESRNIKCGYIETDVSSKIVTNQYVDIDCGLVHLGEYFHNIWDYVATRVELYLPFIGIVPLHVGDVMESDIRVHYRVDVYTGTCLAQVIVLKGNSLATLYTYTGNCAVQLPVTSGQFAALWGALIAAGATAVTAGLGGAGLGAALGAGVKTGGKQLLHSGGASMQRSGGLGANAGAMGIRTPYLIINRNVPLDASMYQTQYGFPANKTVVLGNMTGYTRVKDIHLAGIPCTDDELEMIERLLKDGVIIN